MFVIGIFKETISTMLWFKVGNGSDKVCRSRPEPRTMLPFMKERGEISPWGDIMQG